MAKFQTTKFFSRLIKCSLLFFCRKVYIEESLAPVSNITRSTVFRFPAESHGKSSKRSGTSRRNGQKYSEKFGIRFTRCLVYRRIVENFFVPVRQFETNFIQNAPRRSRGNTSFVCVCQYCSFFFKNLFLGFEHRRERCPNAVLRSK